MTWVKICGMTNLEDALSAVEAGADAVGFVFYEKSPRNIPVEAAREISEKLPNNVEKIGVFVGDDVDPLRVLLQARLTGMQTYRFANAGARRGSNTAIGTGCFPEGTAIRMMMAISMKMVEGDADSMRSLGSSFTDTRHILPQDFVLPEGWFDTIVLDSGDQKVPGGTGKPFDWKKAVPIVEEMRRAGMKLVVAGGLTAVNVGDAVGILRPWGVDVVSGVEASPGKKDPEKVRAFIRAVRERDGKIS